MSATTKTTATAATVSRAVVRRKLDAVLRALSVEDLEARVAPVKCSKHPDSPECGDYYGVPLYMAPESPPPDDPPGE